MSAFIKKGTGSVDDAQHAAAKEWASIAVPNGRHISSSYGGDLSDGTLSNYEGPNNTANMSSTNKLIAILNEVKVARSTGKL